MTTKDLFAEATRHDVKFQLPQGEVTVQQLWKIKQESLFDYEDKLKDETDKFGKSRRRDSANKTNAQELVEMKLAVVSYILDTRKAEADNAQSAAQKKAANAPILELIAKKQADKLGDLTVDELTALLK